MTKRIAISLQEGTLENLESVSATFGVTKSKLIQMTLECVFDSHSADEGFVSFLQKIIELKK